MTLWHKEILLLIALLILLGLLGVFIGHFLLLYLIALSLLLLRQYIQVYRFEKWIKFGGAGKYPENNGIWGDIYYHVYRLRKSQKKRKKKLTKMIDQFRKSTEALPDAAVVLGGHDEIEWANKSAMRVLGLQRADKGQRIINLFRHPDFLGYLKMGSFDNAIIIPSPVDSSIILSVRVVAYGAGLRLLLAQDVTQLKKMESMRKDFVANVSHELRTPLTVLKGYLETLKDMDDQDSPLLTNSLRQMQNQTERMEHLVDDLLLLTRLETQRKKTVCVDICGLLTAICNEEGNLKSASERIQLLLETPKGLMGVQEDLRSAFSNLLINALKYSPEESLVSVRWYRDGNEVRLDVTDHGEGVAPLEIPRITERFYRVDVKRNRKLSGTGLGLAIVKHVLLNHNARLEIASELGKGSCFSCVFPESIICYEQE
ncbi:phosphate regulon sensor histidine kinase PhoR [Methylicorpusculum sp.]|uniref:phosphate regulon sensor histidine kinase PhoR n=1 Tax=Methylicorpusculum sp. TaxID=2713644 RepID=UPI002730A795|nr:phosphate regulon sensor histidine kinase PhoR [Methylicorpusculum sp.]MDP2177987.1 phosphate regulon sensor histidine kinase PhoR [Methylicorpusculum sp.]MDP3528136.1 phosphate regulon sensor histidine kinase PhoR [Methylicorpusculum sp.]